MPVLHLSPSDQTLTATADTPLLDIYAALPAGLLPPFVPAELPGGLGGLVVRGGFGQNFFFASDILGLTFVSRSGRRIVAGGSVVKNVQGYDLTRPFVGSFGVLGEVLSVTLRLRPAPYVLHQNKLGRLSDAPAQARFVWEEGDMVHALHFGHQREVERVFASFGGKALTAPQDYRPLFSLGMGVAAEHEPSRLRDLRFAWASGEGRPAVPAAFEKVAAAL